MRISDSEQYILSKLDTAGINTFKVGMHFLMRGLKQYELLIVTIVNNSGIVNIQEADKYDMVEAPEYSPVNIKFPGPEYVVMMPKYDLHIYVKKR